VLHGALRLEGRRHTTSHGLVGHGAVGLRRVVAHVGVVVGLRLETTATTAVGWEAPVLVAVGGLGRFAAQVLGLGTVRVGLSGHGRASLGGRVSV
jgi:hypothetical protein